MAHVKNIHTVLIANRGEIALRVQRTAKEMGYTTVAVYSDGDAGELFVKSADLSIPLQGRSSTDTYLNIDKIIQACFSSGANAVHPGYGFLSENSDFAQAVIDAGLIWVGPSPESIKVMGDKLSSKNLMEQVQVPILAGVKVNAHDNFESVADELGYPVLIKASAGGGGKGMRVVQGKGELPAAIESAQREAKAAFGDDTVFLERWLTSTRHIEVQVLGDEQGNVVHCFERECSIQRRHQKVIEEAPSSAVSESVRQKLGDAAVSAAKAVGYYSTGTVEFLLSGDDFYFLEMNTRLQVEHPVTEAITGLDLVREQFRIAEGESLGFKQEDLSINGHAIEARLYAEDPCNDFLPAPGTVAIWKPGVLQGVRYDTGVDGGSIIGIDFDPMVAKVISHAPTRKEAASKLTRALSTTRLQGITSNKEFLIETLKTPEFLSGDTTTDFIERVKPARKSSLDSQAINYVVVAISLMKRSIHQLNTKVLSTIPRGWSNTKMPLDLTEYQIEGDSRAVAYKSFRDDSLQFFVGEETYLVNLQSIDDTKVDFTINGVRICVDLLRKNNEWFAHCFFGSLRVEEIERFKDQKAVVKEGELVSPMPSVVRKVCVKVGDVVVKGETLILLESMKMEMKVQAPRDGVVEAVQVSYGKNIETGQILVSLEKLVENTAGESSQHLSVKKKKELPETA